MNKDLITAALSADCEYCGAELPKGVTKETRRVRSSHFAQHALERRRQEESGVCSSVADLTGKQPEALRLAEMLYYNAASGTISNRGEETDSADELRRLHALCEEMGEALTRAVEREYTGFEPDNQSAEYYKWSALVTKWRESK